MQWHFFFNLMAFYAVFAWPGFTIVVRFIMQHIEYTIEVVTIPELSI